MRFDKVTKLNEVFLAALFLTGLTAGLRAQQDLPFNSGSTGADGPLRFTPLGPSRIHHAMAYDAGRQQTVLFGGYAGGPSYETWIWDGTNWTQRVLAPTVSPPYRYFHAMAYDAARQKTVLFGGYNNNFFGDTWLWDGAAWSLASTNGPSSRYQPTMVYDANREVVVLFGGYDPAFGYMNDTWTWDGTNWTKVFDGGPSGRSAAALAYDSGRGKTVLFGGTTGAQETWEWDGTNWMNLTPPIFTSSNSPIGRAEHAMAYDPVRKRTVLFGGRFMPPETWEWDGTNWMNQTPLNLTPATSIPGRANHAMVYDSKRGEVLVYGGDTGGDRELWSWNGSRWNLLSGPSRYFDMSGRPDGIWNFTTIEIPAGISISFLKNTNNTPVRWLASGNVLIDGSVLLNGQDGPYPPNGNTATAGGPGGFGGGAGAIAVNQSGTGTGSPGDGPGGGAPGTLETGYGQSGQYATAYGNQYIQPLIGGSGGGGAASTSTQNGAAGGGGGGAILISSSREIRVNGSVSARGGQSPYGGGPGSGGAILLKADRIVGTGSLNATSGDGSGVGEGRIRLEAYYRQLAGNTTPLSVNSGPVEDSGITNRSTLSIVSIDGVMVPQPPGGNTFVPDVVFSKSNNVNIVVSGTGIPNSTPVRLRVTTSTGVLSLTNSLSAGTVNFSVAVPPGIGTVQAFSEFLLGN